MLNAIIIDDQRVNIEALQYALEEYCPSVHLAGVANSVEKGYTLINEVRPDIVFLDVELNEATGFDLLKMFRHVFFRIIFISAHSRYAVDAFRENATDYLMKPIDVRQLQEAVQRAEEQLAVTAESPAAGVQPDAMISLPTQEGYLFVPYNDIVYCEASGSYSHFHMKDGKKVTVSMRMKECEELLPPTVFFRVHHSYMVNRNYIKKYVRGRGGQIVLYNEQMIEVSAARRDEFLKMMRKP